MREASNVIAPECVSTSLLNHWDLLLFFLHDHFFYKNTVDPQREEKKQQLTVAFSTKGDW